MMNLSQLLKTITFEDVYRTIMKRVRGSKYLRMTQNEEDTPKVCADCEALVFRVQQVQQIT
jgi:hypothetical protein